MQLQDRRVGTRIDHQRVRKHRCSWVGRAAQASGTCPVYPAGSPVVRADACIHRSVSMRVNISRTAGVTLVPSPESAAGSSRFA